jgi:hypothetical protein
MNTPKPVSGSSQEYEMIYRKENYGIPELEKQMAQYIVGSPGHIAAVKLLSEKRLETEGRRHSETVLVSKGANRLSGWAVFIALAALIVSVLASYLNSK